MATAKRSPELIARLPALHNYGTIFRGMRWLLLDPLGRHCRLDDIDLVSIGDEI